MMAPLRCCTFNCKGWNSGYLTLSNYIDSLDICFIQEHWLIHDYLCRINEISSSDFVSVGVSGIDSSCVLMGRPYGGCAIYSHTSIVLCTARINYIYDMIFYRFSKFMSRCLDMDHPLVSFVISDSMHLAYSFIGYNFRFGSSHLKCFNDNDLCIANTIRFYRHMYGSSSPNEDCISTLSS